MEGKNVIPAGTLIYIKNSGYSFTLPFDLIYLATTADYQLPEVVGEPVAIPGRPGWRRDEEGREWYSDAWLEGVTA
jgi:hypothetical protein